MTFVLHNMGIYHEDINFSDTRWYGSFRIFFSLFFFLNLKFFSRVMFLVSFGSIYHSKTYIPR